jgi:hypothetical protein
LGLDGLAVVYSGDQPPAIKCTRGIGCCVVYFVDGIQTRVGDEYDVEDLPPPTDIGGIEVYGMSETPPQFYGLALSRTGLPGKSGGARWSANCETVVLWTKEYLGQP